jgi:hypothetical protein
MITNFEEFTGNLTQEEIEILPYVMNVLKCASVVIPYKSPLIVSKVQAILGSRQIRMSFNERKLRKFVNYIRINGIEPLIATKDGYYITRDPKTISKQISSLEERARSIQMCANGLMKFTK